MPEMPNLMEVSGVAAIAFIVARILSVIVGIGLFLVIRQTKPLWGRFSLALFVMLMAFVLLFVGVFALFVWELPGVATLDAAAVSLVIASLVVFVGWALLRRHMARYPAAPTNPALYSVWDERLRGKKRGDLRGVTGRQGGRRR